MPVGTGDRELIGENVRRDVSWARAVGAAVDKPALVLTLLAAIAAAMVAARIFRAPVAFFVVAALLVVAWTRLANPSFWRRLRRIHADAAPALPDVMEVRDPAVASLVVRLTRARQARTRTIAESPFGAHHALASSQRPLADLEARAVVAAARAEYVRRFLSEVDESAVAIDGEVARLRRAEEAASSDDVRGAYRNAVVWSTRRRDAARRLDAQAAALVAQLEYLVALLETVPATATESELLRMEEADRLIGTETVIAEAENELMRLTPAPPAAADASLS